ncbi:hypothetical protein [Kordiimonas aquimaris]|uniref:hypothetical protein n=1 Tax=Kordiimonas aquimaris TaxID=707591 RepID=UPI0021CF6B08|nr:hypothetical protein [Kordiimonas aquimaris]
MHNKLLFGGLLLLSACSTPPVTTPAAEIVEPQTPTPISLPQEDPAPEPTTPAPIIVDFDMINGQTPASVQNYLGQPSLVRRDENVQIMIYETDVCVFQVTFYEPANGDHFRAEHTDARTRKGLATDAENCVQQLLSVQQ